MKRGRDISAESSPGSKPRSKSKQKSEMYKQMNPSRAAVEHNASRAPPKVFSDPNVNVDGRALTAKEKEFASKRKERAGAYAGGAPTSTTRKAAGKLELRTKLNRMEERIAEAAELNVFREEYMLSGEAGCLEAEPGTLERTGKVTQKELKANVASVAAAQAFDLELGDALGPYGGAWSRNGRHLLLHGRKGHLALIDAAPQRPLDIVKEFYVHETVRDACFLHNESLFAAAQKKHLFIYDRDGVELHCLRQHVEPTKLAFLPYHFLLAAASHTGWLKYTDTSTGQLVASHRTKLGPCHVMSPNPSNGVLHCGHHNGTVTLWSPSSPQPLVSMLAHRGPLSAVAIDPTGNYMATAGLDANFKVWDLRMYKETHAYLTHKPVTSLSVSQRGLLAVGFGSHVQIWNDALHTKAKSPYMRHELPGKTCSEFMAWRPYEDVLAIGHSSGLCSMLVPGAGEPNYDALEANPFESTKERREAEVHQLLDKLPPETIALDQNFVGRVDSNSAALKAEQAGLKQADDDARNANAPPAKEKNRARGRSKIGAKLKRKRKNIIDEERVALQEMLHKEQADKKAAREAAKAERKKAKGKGGSATKGDGGAGGGDVASQDAAPAAIARFFSN